MKYFDFIEEYWETSKDFIISSLLNEHPQLITLIIMHIKNENIKKDIMLELPNRDEIVWRILQTKSVRKDILNLVHRKLKKKLSLMDNYKFFDEELRFDNVRILLSTLNSEQVGDFLAYLESNNHLVYKETIDYLKENSPEKLIV